MSKREHFLNCILLSKVRIQVVRVRRTHRTSGQAMSRYLMSYKNLLFCGNLTYLYKTLPLNSKTPGQRSYHIPAPRGDRAIARSAWATMRRDRPSGSGTDRRFSYGSPMGTETDMRKTSVDTEDLTRKA